VTPRTPIGRSCSQTSYLAPPPLGPGGLSENMIDAKQRDVESGLLKVVSKADVMILFGLVALDQVPLRHFFIVSASCETTRTGMAVAAPRRFLTFCQLILQCHALFRITGNCAPNRPQTNRLR
jgi:hypothetical protein